MRALPLPLVLLAGLAASALAEEVAVEDVQRDLRLSAWLTSEATVVPGEPVRIGAKIVNRSRTRAYPLVRPGDGSESGWREPHVFFTAVWHSPREGEVPVEEKAWGRCGLYDAEWQKAVVTLAPGEELDLTMHLTAASTSLDFQQEGRTEVRLHYRWSAGRSTQGGPDPAPGADLGPMTGVPPFELISKAVVLNVRRPVDVALTAAGSLRVGETRTLADLLRVVVRNRGDDKLDFRPQHIQFELSATQPADLLERREVVDPQARVRAAPIRAGGKRVFEGAEAFRLLRHLRLQAKSKGILKVAAVYAPGAYDRGPDRSLVRIRSQWVTIRIGPAEQGAAQAPLTTVEYRLSPTRGFWIADSDLQGTSLADLTSALRDHRRHHPGSAYEVKAEVKVTPAEVASIRAAFRSAGARLSHLWAPVSDRPDGEAEAGPYGPGYVDLLR